MVYVPAGRFGKMYLPFLPVTVDELKLLGPVIVMVQPERPSSHLVSNGEPSPSQSSNLLPLMLPVPVGGTTVVHNLFQTITYSSACRLVKLGDAVLDALANACASVSPV